MLTLRCNRYCAIGNGQWVIGNPSVASSIVITVKCALIYDRQWAIHQSYHSLYNNVQWAISSNVVQVQCSVWGGQKVMWNVQIVDWCALCTAVVDALEVHPSSREEGAGRAFHHSRVHPWAAQSCVQLLDLFAQNHRLPLARPCLCLCTCSFGMFAKNHLLWEVPIVSSSAEALQIVFTFHKTYFYAFDSWSFQLVEPLSSLF